MSESRRPNRLAGQTSPYLLQHLYNPVDWRPWGREALDEAVATDRPIFLSIGYAACHWCHVMERESFEDEGIATILNARYVPIKVDREERPDLDELYMNAAQAFTGHGGWPLSVFLRPSGEPFFAGTYFPPRTVGNRIGFEQLLREIDRAWGERRAEVDDAAARLTEVVRQYASTGVGAGGEAIEIDAAREAAIRQLESRFDPPHGGFGGAPKFPPDQALALVLRQARASGRAELRTILETTLDGMALGGMYDHVGGGFARYSVDERWLVPHFEKMLYNQALLVPVYADAWAWTGKPLYRRVVHETLAFVRRELTDDAGGLFSSLDADSEGVEGRFYVWTPDEVRAVLGAEHGASYSRWYDVTDHGNFEGRNIPHLSRGGLEDRAAELGEATEDVIRRAQAWRDALLSARAERVRPATDDKVLASWNGLMITAFCKGYQRIGDAADLESARRAAAFVREHMFRDGRLLVSYRAGSAQLNGYLDDYAFLARAAIDLYESDFDPSWLRWAETLAEAIREHFVDRSTGALHFVSDDHEHILARSHSTHDGALPSGAAVAAEALGRLSRHTGREELRETAEAALRAYREGIEGMPSAYSAMLLAAGASDDDAIEVAIAGRVDDERVRALVARVHARYTPGLVLAAGDDPSHPLLRGRVGGDPAAYVCVGRTCSAPVADPAALDAALDAADGGARTETQE